MSTFTGVPGSAEAMPSYLAAAYEGVLAYPFSFDLYAISSTEILVRFDAIPNLDDPKVIPSSASISALDKSHYSLSTTSISAPTVISVRISGTEPNSVILTVSHPLKYNQSYSITISAVRSADGTRGVASETRNFTANTEDPPLVVGAFFAQYNKIAVVFDRTVVTVGLVTVEGSSRTASVSGNAIYVDIAGLTLSAPITVVVNTVTDTYGSILSSYTTSVIYHPDFNISTFGTLKCLDAYVAQYSQLTPLTYLIVARLVLSLPINTPTDADFTISPIFINRNNVKKIEAGFASTSVVPSGSCSYFLDLYLDGSSPLNATEGFTIASAVLTATGSGGPTTINNIVVRPLGDAASAQNAYLDPGSSIAGSFDRNIFSQSTSLTVSGAQSLVKSVDQYTDLPHLYFAVCDLWYSYASHLSQTHTGSDPFVLAGSNLPTSPTLAAVRTSLTSFIDKFQTHPVKAYHQSADPNLAGFLGLSISADATLVEMSQYLRQILSFFDAHTLNAGLHTLNGASQSIKWTSFVYDNTVRTNVRDLKIGAEYTMSTAVRSAAFNANTQLNIFNDAAHDFEIIGNAKSPQVSAAYMQTAVEERYGDPRLWKDRVVVWFSKPMQLVKLDSLNIGVTTDAKSWVSDRYVKCDVSGTTAGSRSLSATGMLDLASNGVT